MSGSGYTVSLHGEIIKEDSGYVKFTTSSMCMEDKAITEILEWVRHQNITQIEAQREDTSHTTMTLKDNGFKRGASRTSDLRGASRRRTNQLLTGTISLDTLRWTLQRRGEQLWSNPMCGDPDSTPK